MVRTYRYIYDANEFLKYLTRRMFGICSLNENNKAVGYLQQRGVGALFFIFFIFADKLHDATLV